MQGFNVLHPMGWDAFGLPAERAAVRENLHPAEITAAQHRHLPAPDQAPRLSYDWDREVNTSSPDYYRWTQWIFLKLYEKGLAYMAEVPVNWCPALGTVLANEEVKDGVYVETGDPVERRLMRQWMLRITAYAERLLDDLDDAGLAGERQGDAAQLDRPVRRRGSRFRDRRPRTTSFASSPPARTPCSAPPTWCWLRSIRWSTR